MYKIPVKILGTGAYLPSRLVTSSMLEKELGYSPGTFKKASGVNARYYVAHETSTEMGMIAAERALSISGIDKSEIDAIISVSGVPQQSIPTNAALIHQKLGLNPKTVAFDINSTCLSFLTGLFSMGNMIACGVYRNVLLVSSDIGSTALDPKDPKTASLFGDGAAACVLGPSTKEGIIASYFETRSEYAQACKCEAGGTLLGIREDVDRQRYYFRMNGPQLFKATIPHVLKMIKQLRNASDREIDLFIPHQASPLALDLFQKRLDVSDDRFMHIVRDYGNMIATSLPFTLNKAIEEKRLKRGDTALLLGSGAGLTIGGIFLEY